MKETISPKMAKAAIRAPESSKENEKLLAADIETARGEGKADKSAATFQASAIKLAFCFIGLQGSYLTWGFVQEIVMTRDYGNGAKFPSSTFVVFSNRYSMWVESSTGVWWYLIVSVNLSSRFSPTHPRPHAPLVQFMPCSLSNVLSSWAQYECLKYISFPMQVVSKSCKIIPVMLVGMVVHGKSYPWIEYLEAAIISFGVSLFSLSESKAKDDGEGGNTQMIGLLLVVMYLACDSFTSQWQNRVFEQHKIDQYQMMLGINIFSIFFTTMAMLKGGGMLETLSFLAAHPAAVTHLAILSATSASGQVFIFYTIKNFGPVLFTIIMTTRQMLSMVLSCFWFGHVLGPISLCGAAVVFSTLGYRIRRKYQAQNQRSAGR
ncbi:unnamed protein product [Chrysoparadoxa australica]